MSTSEPAPLLVMVAGPYRSGAADEAARAANLRALNAVAAEVAGRGHLPIIGVNAALPVLEAAGVDSGHPWMMAISLALAARCDAIIRIGGPSKGADDEVEVVRAHGGKVYESAAKLPQTSARP